MGPWSLVGKIVYFLAQGLFEIPGDDPSCCILREGGGAVHVEMCIETRYPCEVIVTSYASLCKGMPLSGHSS